mgnify:FL=1
MQIEQFVMAYGVEQDRLRAILPEGFTSLRPVLRINGEIRDGAEGYLEFNTAVEKDGVRGWLNIGSWDRVPFMRAGKTTVFRTALLEISFTGVGLAAGCPAEQGNAGCFFRDGSFQAAEHVTANKEFCDCAFAWQLPGGVSGVSIGRTLPALPTEVKTVYPRQDCTVEQAAVIPCDQVLGTYKVTFDRVSSLK